MLDLAKSMKATTFQTLVRIRFPSALPNLFAGMKVGITLALIGAIVGEFIASRRGLGHVILTAQGQFDMPTMFVGVVILTIMGTVLFFAVDVLERVALPWHVSRRREDAQEAQMAAAAARG
jgi:NitT/TauT family transport system permease protein